MPGVGSDLQWFVAMALAAAGAWALGVWFGRRCGSFTAGAVTVSVVCLLAWGWLTHHPAVAVQLLPVWFLRHVEGTAAVAFFLFITGIVLGRAELPRQKRVAAWATLLGGVYFLQGSLWLIQTNPQVGFAEETGDGAVRQSVDYSCVPAACATALNLLGHPTSEAHMVRLTDTRPGVGSTTVRALYGLNRRLDELGSTGRFYLLPVTAEGLRAMPMPALTALKFERTRRHMVTLVETDAWGVVFEDPVDGRLYLPWSDFTYYYGGEVLLYADR